MVFGFSWVGLLPMNLSDAEASTNQVLTNAAFDQSDFRGWRSRASRFLWSEVSAEPLVYRDRLGIAS